MFDNISKRTGLSIFGFFRGVKKQDLGFKTVYGKDDFEAFSAWVTRKSQGIYDYKTENFQDYIRGNGIKINGEIQNADSESQIEWKISTLITNSNILDNETDPEKFENKYNAVYQFLTRNGQTFINFLVKEAIERIKINSEQIKIQNIIDDINLSNKNGEITIDINLHIKGISVAGLSTETFYLDEQKSRDEPIQTSKKAEFQTKPDMLTIKGQIKLSINEENKKMCIVPKITRAEFESQSSLLKFDAKSKTSSIIFSASAKN